MKNLFYLFILSFFLISCEEEVPPITYTLTTQVTPAGSGTVDPSSGTFDEGSSVTLLATPSENYSFKQWTGTGSGTANPLTFKIISNTSITVEFELIDTDKDGITDSLDKCPNTPAGTAVNSEGCATSQLDSDGDGVTDDKDLCSDTPEGKTVDETGCSSSQIDTDGDGVTDDKDLCPDTPSGADVNSDGCSSFTSNYNDVYWRCDGSTEDCDSYVWFLDNNINLSFEEENSYFTCFIIPLDGEDIAKDFVKWNQEGENWSLSSELLYNYSDSISFVWTWMKDGEIDNKWYYKYVVKGNAMFATNFNQEENKEYNASFFKTESKPTCTSEIDTDEDGVTDDKDQCPNTPEGESADENGCSASQKDTDGDGIKDNIDQCPETPEGESVDENGCSSSQKDTDSDGITDDKDNCINIPNSDQLDTDEDGIGDVCDEDVDGDGITNDQDICPDTPKDTDVNSEGCPVIYLAENGITIKVKDDAQVGSVYKLKGISYTIVDNENIADYISSSIPSEYQYLVTSRVTSLQSLFYNNKADDINVSSWDVSNVESIYYLFDNASNFNSDISAWDVSKVKRMTGIFKNASSFNQDISSWDVSNVESMNSMFYYASSFNQDISSWDVSNVNDMFIMFHYASSFNQDIGNWNVGNVTDMRGIFYGASSFNKDISSWDVSKVVYMSTMFLGSPFNQDISSWDVSNAITMRSMFHQNSSFNQDISSWDVSSVTDMSYMFYAAENFNQDISSWNVSNILTMEGMFHNATRFNQDLSGWNLSNITECSNFYFNADSWTLPKPNLDGCTFIYLADNGITVLAKDNALVGETYALNGNNYAVVDDSNIKNYINEIDASKLQYLVTTKVTSMYALFHNYNASGIDISSWDVSNVTTMEYMFDKAENFNSDISSWDVSNVTNMRGMFKRAYKFNQDLSGWDTNNLSECSDFDLDASSWTLPRPDIKNCGMIYFAENGITVVAKDNAQVGEIYTLNGKSYMIVDENNINYYIDNTDASDFQYLVTTKVTNMYALFYLDITDGINISSWDVSNVTNMAYMFDKAENFNSDISSWDVSNVTNMRGMFKRAYKFNQDLSSWDVSNVTECSNFKDDANSFDLSIPSFTLCNPD